MQSWSAPWLAWSCYWVALVFYYLGFSQGSTAAINEVCVGGTIKDQDGGRSCTFWLIPPNQQGKRKG